MMEGKQVVQLATVPGFQHAEDNYWYRPVVFGKSLFTYIAHVPPGGSMPPNGHSEEEDPIECSLFMFEGELEIFYGEEKFTIGAETALHLPLGVAFGVKNRGDITASFILTLALEQSENVTSVEELRQRYAEKNRTVKTPEETNAMRAIGT